MKKTYILKTRVKARESIAMTMRKMKTLQALGRSILQSRDQHHHIFPSNPFAEIIADPIPTVARR